MNISVFGLGYVGAVVTGCLAREGHRITGVDTEAAKVGLVNAGKPPIMEPGLAELLAEGVRESRILATTDHVAAVIETDLSLLCVGTPSKPSGELDLSQVARVCDSIGVALRRKPGYHLVVARSTMLPGSVQGTIIPVLERASHKQAGRHFGVAINPEFLREASAVQDFFHPPKTVIGAASERDFRMVAALYEHLDAPLIRTSIPVAEMVKYTDNIFHALKITFGNEIGAVCKRLGLDGAEVMDIFCQDTKLNLSPAYFRPGFVFGGSCLPKDLRALTRLAHTQDIDVPLLRAILASNEQQLHDAVKTIQATGRRKIGVLGFAFKGGTDDLREAPMVAVVEALLGKGCDLKIYDRHVSLARLVGANRRFIEQHLPHLTRLMVETPEDIIAHAEIILIGNQNAEFADILKRLRPDQHVIDLTPASRTRPVTSATYERISG
jgi:GDP-mannose 6-dehydrogenase